MPNSLLTMLPVIFGSRADHGYAPCLDRQFMFGWINYKVIRIRAKYILGRRTEINVPH
jgi:hypothetical protein